MPSPKVVQQPNKQLTFMEAIEVILTGGSVTKVEWGDRDCYAILDNEMLRLHKADGQCYDWLVSEGDMRGDDYERL